MKILEKKRFLIAENQRNGKGLVTRALGRFYTPNLIAEHLINRVVNECTQLSGNSIRIIEPFSGDGRLVCLLLERLASLQTFKTTCLDITLWDADRDALQNAVESVKSTLQQTGLLGTVKYLKADSFALAPKFFGKFDVCITNPPWENLKPDRRELMVLDDSHRTEYIHFLQERDDKLTSLYPLSQPKRKFSGWGTNLARCGTEISLKLTRLGGVCGVVSPSSLLADQMSQKLRTWLFKNHSVTDIAYYAAEAKLFEAVDQPCITFVCRPGKPTSKSPSFSCYDRTHARAKKRFLRREWDEVVSRGYVFPLQFGLNILDVLASLRALPKFSELESDTLDGLWAGRELDETGYVKYIASKGTYRFLKGRAINRYMLVEPPNIYVKPSGPKIPVSANHIRIAWRDVARPNRKRRMTATLINPRIVTGNSLHVAYFRNENLYRLRALLAIVNSLVFEAQIRTLLATAHISLGVVRQAHIPSLGNGLSRRLAKLVERRLNGDGSIEPKIEASVAQAYGLGRDSFGRLVDSFKKIEECERVRFLDPKLWSKKSKSGFATVKKQKGNR